MRIVVALGGNALLRRGEPMTAKNQRANIRRAASALAELIADGHSLVITHGNGPQVGLLALQAANSSDTPFPLDVLDAESAGMIGYVLQQELGNAMKDKLFATLLTQVKVDANDPAFDHPTKPIGPLYAEAVARRLEAERGWRIAKDNDKWRRVVPSPKPLVILETEVLRFLIERGVVVICAGGGGIPVVELDSGAIAGVEAVIDKDHASALLARQIGADLLLMLTDVDAVYLDWGMPQARPLKRARASDLPMDTFAVGSMRPKVEAAILFTGETGRPSAIGRLEDAMEIVAGRRGTQIDPEVAASR
ncbi:carbamate kinase [Mesorhizobium sp. CCNWLW179-1]|uniref:carbamate kinase n=1 Tax=unclassified Mesorhizobium TaxID=325217 RepID=UPI0030151598